MDLSDLLAMFLEESFEGLDVMESGLLKLQAGEVNMEEINNIFRAVHSIKGGAGTFGIHEVIDLSHVVETLLDDIRKGNQEISRGSVDLMLGSVDCLREMLQDKRQGRDIDKSASVILQNQLIDEFNPVDSSQPGVITTEQNTDEAGGVNESSFVVEFSPHTNLFKTGNDPLSLISLLKDYAEVDAVPDLEKVPDFFDIDPCDSYINWNITVKGGVTKEKILEVFEWVEDECDLVVMQSGQNPEKNNNTESQGSIPGKQGDGERPSSLSAESKIESSIRVNTRKIDELINMVGELVITQAMLNEACKIFKGKEYAYLHKGMTQLERHTRDIQENVMLIRMLPIGFVFNRFPRLVRDLSMSMNKEVNLQMIGEQTELDKSILEKISDPLVHLVRNSLDHGLETAEERIAAGKNETGNIILNAFHQGGNIIIEIKDDGAGLNHELILEKARSKGLIDEDFSLSPEQINELIFLPGFSTAETVSDISGRGVGMDVVRRNISSIGGTVHVESQRGLGSTFTIRLPLTLAILDGQIVQVGEESYIIPLISIIESLSAKSQSISTLAGKGEMLKFREEYLPILRLYDILGFKSVHTDLTKGLLVVVENGGEKIAIFVDDLQAQQQVVLKSLENNYMKVDGVSGATIMGDGSVALILDIPGLIKIAHKRAEHNNVAGWE